MPSIPGQQPPGLRPGRRKTVSWRGAARAGGLRLAVKKTAGRVTGSRRLRAEGRGDQAKGNLKQAGAKVKDALRH